MTANLFDRRRVPALVGVLHLPPLPGGPRPSPGLHAVMERARADARTLGDGGADAAILENLGDAPFHRGAVDPYTISAMTRVALAVREAAPELPLGINVLRNDARAALAIAATIDGAFIRVNVHTGVMVTDQGLIEGQARETLLERQRLGAQVPIAADVFVKHAVPLGRPELVATARDTYLRGGADALIVTGEATGRPTEARALSRLRQSLPDAPLWVGSGVEPAQLPELVGMADALIVGTYLHRDGDLQAPLTASRLARVRAALGPA